MTEPIDTKDLLISRLVDGEASTGDWLKFKELAAADESVWADLAGAQRQHQDLADEVDRALAVADRIEAPAHEEISYSFQRRWSSAASWGGWLAAAAVGLAWAFGTPQTSGPGNGVNRADLGPSFASFKSPTEALRKYYETADPDRAILQEVPTMTLLAAEPDPNGEGCTIVYLQQFVARAKVPDLYWPTLAEDGRPLLAPAQIEQMLRDGRRPGARPD